MTRRLYTNGSKAYVINPFSHFAAAASELHLAAPYFTSADVILDELKKGKTVRLLVGLNAATDPNALSKLYGLPNLAIRYLTRRFHAKIFIFDNFAMVGSSNLTDGGLRSNREAVVCLDRDEDADTIAEVKALFIELWDSAHVLTDHVLEKFRHTYFAVTKQARDADKQIEDAVGKAEPHNINVGSHTQSRERIFLEGLRRLVHEQYRPAFNDVTNALTESNLHRPELMNLGEAAATNRYLNWVRLEQAPGDELWRSAPTLPDHDRHDRIVRFGKEWQATKKDRISPEFVDWFNKVKTIFSSPETLDDAGQEDLTEGLKSLHAFSEQMRFVKGGRVNLGPTFWSANDNDVERVRRTLSYLLHGPGDFIVRLHDVLYDAEYKLAYFGKFSALELYGTVKPGECPPMNSRMAKAMRFLGFNVPT